MWSLRICILEFSLEKKKKTIKPPILYSFLIISSKREQCVSVPEVYFIHTGTPHTRLIGGGLLTPFFLWHPRLSAPVQLQVLRWDIAGNVAQERLNWQKGTSIPHWNWVYFHLQTFEALHFSVAVSIWTAKNWGCQTGFHFCLFQASVKLIKATNAGKTERQ